MKTQADCIPCILKQAVETSKIAGLNASETKRVVGKSCKYLAKPHDALTPPEISGVIQDIVKKESKIPDIYREIKIKSNRLALGLYDKYKNKVKHSANRLVTAVELSIAGNIIDFGIHHSLDIIKELEKLLKEENALVRNKKTGYFAFEELKRSIDRSKTILFLGDNTGETVFDRILIEEIIKHKPEIKIVYAVRSKPVLNDALEEDAVMCGIDRLARIISTGSSIPGTTLRDFSREFNSVYRTADMVVSKGQGNFESFADPDKPVFYLFMAKCALVANEAGCKIGEINLYMNQQLI